MKTLFVLSALAEIAVLFALYFAGRKHVLSGMRLQPPLDRPPAKPLRAAMIVPVTGDTPTVRNGLASLLKQEYPGIRYVIVTRDEEDPATDMVRALIEGREDAVLLTSGPATTSGQKNHNLLAGVRHLGDWPEAYIFCDSSHLAKPDLAALLLEPLANEWAVISGGFHRVIPRDTVIPTLGMLNVCLALHCLQPIRAITQPWGGAMAITREAFEENGVAKVWAHNIVDDFSMGPLLAKKRIRTWPVADACLDTPLKAVKWKLWEDWLTRQLLYLKFCTPEMWLGALAVVWLFLFPPLAALGGVLGALLGCAGWWWLGAALAYAGGFTAVGMAFRNFSPRPMPLWHWMLGFFTTFLVTSWCYLRTWTTFTMSWRGISYKVTWGGRVVKVLRS
ncbi:glycosyltransferase [Fundidesulfovibrio agrisoli]|uniref:glycosyltransferase n=1 Tax=Fundidesulfovibrio agrisoli TaxID=2922717 RepID=UPI001FACAFCB